MNVKKFFANSSREALRKVRDALGPDAVILSNRTTDGGVEILALANEDIASLSPPAGQEMMPEPEMGYFTEAHHPHGSSEPESDLMATLEIARNRPTMHSATMNSAMESDKGK